MHNDPPPPSYATQTATAPEPFPHVVRPLTIALGQKGGVCVYGLQRFPVTLYASQWAKLLDNKDAILAFIAANATALAHKPTA